MTMNVWIRSLGGVGGGKIRQRRRRGSACLLWSCCCGGVGGVGGVGVVGIPIGYILYLRCGGRVLLRCRGKNSIVEGTCLLYWCVL